MSEDNDRLSDVQIHAYVDGQLDAAGRAEVEAHLATGPEAGRGAELGDAPMQVHLVRPAAFAHAVYTTDLRHPVEVSAEGEADLVAWLSRRLHTDIRAPNLATLGYHLVGGRLLALAEVAFEALDAARAPG